MADTAVQVTRQDQDNINEFNKLNARMHDVNVKVKALKKKLEDLEDAGNELMLCDDESIRYVTGECFVHMEKEAAEERLQKLGDTVKEDVSAQEAQVEDIQAKMKELKTVLYGKFGNSINLEE
ncbi:Prefoldin beta-like protein [Dunaliella salina]|uniref:Prefoldin subunit 4 n=1 Tax=Dunaliella salina TaxID=3046 RepID=A0ABQ7GLA0_DUNSA|nr:Prefoldin beta-like protein [Dunaliella salina]|eukprot:KAF5835394.1 Prefoldin beta-like protein [Dunaliella salina]